MYRNYGKRSVYKKGISLIVLIVTIIKNNSRNLNVLTLYGSRNFESLTICRFLVMKK